jgi:uncharacterized membrane protein
MPDQSRSVTERNVRWAWPISFPLALLGLADSAYLTYAHFQHVKLVCSDNGAINCTKVTHSSQSEIFGHIPVALTGLLFYVAMVVLTSPWAWSAVNPWVGRLRLLGAVSGMGMVVYLVFVEAVQLHAICLYCTGVHIVTFALLIVLSRVSPTQLGWVRSRTQ